MPPDSNITMTWQEVPGAAGYWIQIYQFMGGDLEAKLLARAAGAVRPQQCAQLLRRLRGRAGHRLQARRAGGAGAHAARTLLNLVEYRVRVSAVNARGELLAFTYGDWEYVREPGLVPPLPGRRHQGVPHALGTG